MCTELRTLFNFRNDKNFIDFMFFLIHERRSLHRCSSVVSSSEHFKFILMNYFQFYETRSQSSSRDTHSRCFATIVAAVELPGRSTCQLTTNRCSKLTTFSLLFVNRFLDACECVEIGDTPCSNTGREGDKQCKPMLNGSEIRDNELEGGRSAGNSYESLIYFRMKTKNSLSQILISDSLPSPASVDTFKFRCSFYHSQRPAALPMCAKERRGG